MKKKIMSFTWIIPVVLISLTALRFDSTVVTESAEGSTYVVSTEKSKLNWKGRWIKPAKGSDEMVEYRHHYGTVQISDGQVTQKGDQVSGDFTVDLTTISNSDLEGKEKEKIQGHLKSPEFFNVKEYAQAEVKLNNIKDGSAHVVITVMGVDIEETVSVDVFSKGDNMMIEGEFGIDMSPLDFKMMSPLPEKPEEGHIDPVVDFELKATLVKNNS